MCFRQGRALPPEAATDAAHGPEPARQLAWGPAEGGAQWGSERASQGARRPSSAGPRPGPGPGVRAGVQLALENEPSPRCARRDSSEGLAPPGRRRSRLQVPLGERAGKAPARVLVGWGKGPCGTQQSAPWGVAGSRQAPRFLPGETGWAAAPGALPAPAQGQGQGQRWCPAQATPTPTQAHPPAPHATGGLDHLLASLAQASPGDRPGESGNPWSGLLDSSNEATLCQDKAFFGSQRLPTPGHPRTASPDRAPEPEAAAALPKQPESPAEKPPFYTFNLAGPAPPPPRSRLEARAPPEGPALRACSGAGSRAPLSACPATCPATVHGQRPAPPPREATQRPASGAPACQLQDPVEGHVPVFDLDTGNTRLGLLCQDHLGSRVVLVGLLPHHPSAYALGGTPAAPAASSNSQHAGLRPAPQTQSSPVPSSISSGGYQEVALSAKEAKLSLEPGNGPGVGLPLQVGDRAPDAGWPRPAAEDSESTHTIWVLDAPGMQDAVAGRAQRPRGTASELAPAPAPPAPAQEAARPALQADTGSHSWGEASTAHLWAEGGRQGPLGGWPPPGEQHPVPGQHPAAGQPPSAEQPPFPGQPPRPGTPLARQRSLPGRPSSRQEPASARELLLARGPPSAREAGQAPAPGQEGAAPGLPVHVGVLRVPLVQEKACVYVNREPVGLPAGPNAPWLSAWPPLGALRVPGGQPALVALAAPGTSHKVLPAAPPPGPRLQLTAEDVTDSPLLGRACYALPGRAQSSAAVVIDTGSGFTKCGLAGEGQVLSVVPSRVQLLPPPGQPRYAVLGAGGGACTVLTRGAVSDWDALEALWQHLFHCTLGLRPEELAVLVADSPAAPRADRAKVAEILFERFQVPAMQAVRQALLALYAHGRTAGLVLGSGHGTSYVAPILPGDPAPLDTYRLDVAGADLTAYLAELLLAGGHAPAPAGLVSHIKEACCYVALGAQAPAPVDFVLPDGQAVTLGAERSRCPEALFRPQLLGLRQPGLPQLALLSISRLDARRQEQLLANVVLDGGSTLLRGFAERLGQELGPRATVLGSPHRALAAWLGGSIMAARDSFQGLWLSRREYEEEGPWVIYKYRL